MKETMEKKQAEDEIAALTKRIKKLENVVQVMVANAAEDLETFQRVAKELRDRHYPNLNPNKESPE